MATVPSAALIGFVGPQQDRPAQSVETTAPMLPGSSVQAGEAGKQQRVPEAAPAAVEASYYGAGFAGQPTANGEIFNPRLLTAAHRTLPFGSLVRVTDAVTGRNVVVRINDRGPFHGNRDIDLSEAAASRLGMIGSGTGKVVLEVLRQA